LLNLDVGGVALCEAISYSGIVTSQTTTDVYSKISGVKNTTNSPKKDTSLNNKKSSKTNNTLNTDNLKISKEIMFESPFRLECFFFFFIKYHYFV
jgi:hypothetical protein